MKKYLLLILFIFILINTSLKAQEDSDSSSASSMLFTSLELKAGLNFRVPIERSVNPDSVLNLRQLVPEVNAKFRLDMYPAYWLSIISLLEVDAAGMKYLVNDSDLKNSASIGLGFQQLYVELFAGAFSWTIGKAPLSHGLSTFLSPAGYTSNVGSFFNEDGTWQLKNQLSIGIFQLSLIYNPTFTFSNDARSVDRTELEQLFSWLETENTSQILSIDLALFLEPANLHLLGYLQQQKGYDFNSGFWGALALTFTSPIGEFIHVYGEAILGNGFKSSTSLEASGYRPLGIPNIAAPKYKLLSGQGSELEFASLAAVRVNPVSNMDIALEYYFNSTGWLKADIDKLYEGINDYRSFSGQDPRHREFWSSTLTQNIIFNPFLLARHLLTLSFSQRNIFSRIDISLLASMSLIDASLFMRLTVDYKISDNLKIELKNDVYTGSEIGIMTLNPLVLNTYLGLVLNY